MNSTANPSKKKSARCNRPDYPLRIHKGTARWCKKIQGRVHYFGTIAKDPEGEAAWVQYCELLDTQEQGNAPRDRRRAEGVSVEHLFNLFLDSVKAQVATGEASPATYTGYVKTCSRVAKVFGKPRKVESLGPRDFGELRTEFAKTMNLSTLAVEVVKTRVVFNWAYASELIASPARFGPQFKKPSKKHIDRKREDARLEHGPRSFTDPKALRGVIESLPVPLKAMTYLAINCGIGNADLADMPIAAVDVGAGWLDFRRGKTGSPRRCPLWPETLEAIKEAIAARPEPKAKADAQTLFLTKDGRRWVEFDTGRHMDLLSKHFSNALKKAGVKTCNLSFYALRRTFRTVGGASLDVQATEDIMGHAKRGMDAHYDEPANDARRQRVVDHIHAWLFAEGDAPEKKNSQICDPTDPATRTPVCDPTNPGRKDRKGSKIAESSDTNEDGDEPHTLKLFVG